MTHPTPEYVELIERLRATRVSNYVGETGYGGPKHVLMNSDGPAAADALEAQSRAYVALAERVGVLEEALAPFARAAERVHEAADDGRVLDLYTVSAPIVVGDLRRARAALNLQSTSEQEQSQ